MSKALQVWSHVFCKDFDRLPANVQEAIQRRVDEMGRRLESFPHKKLSARSEYRLRVGDYRVLYQFSVVEGRIELRAVGHRKDVYKT